MPELRFVADVFSPHHQKILKYSGNHPSKILKIIPLLVKDSFRITSTKFFEDEIKWDKSAEAIEFYGQWRGRDDKDGRTSIWIKVKAIGKQNSKDKKGWVTIYIHPYMITKLPYSNVFDKFLAKTYSFLFYGNQRKEYIKQELIFLKRFEERLKKELGIS